MSVDERLEHLERKVRWMRRLGAVGVALVAAVFLMGQGGRGRIMGRSLELRDGKGITRAKIGVLENEMSYIKFSHKDGKPRATLFVGSQGDSTLMFTDQSGVNRLVMGLDPDGGPFVSLFDKQNKARLRAGVRQVVGAPGEWPFVELLDARGRVVWQAPKE